MQQAATAGVPPLDGLQVLHGQLGADGHRRVQAEQVGARGGARGGARAGALDPCGERGAHSAHVQHAVIDPKRVCGQRVHDVVGDDKQAVQGMVPKVNVGVDEVGLASWGGGNGETEEGGGGGGGV